MAYTYDPSQNIQQGFQKASSGIGNIFTQVIAQQQRDYNLAENAFQNIEALKKNLNIFGQKSITSKANDLLGKTSSAIMKNGKLDYSALGDIRQQVSEIGDLKQGYEVGAKEYERMLQLGVANKDNLVSFEKFYKDLSAKMGDENLVKNPQDLQKALADTYTNNLDSFKMFGKSYLSSNPYQKISQDIKDPKTGALMRVQGELPAGWTLDAQGNKIPPPPKTMIVNGQQVTMDYADQELARLQATSPEQLVLMRQQAGFAGQNFSDKEIVKASIDKIPMTVQSTQVKSADELMLTGSQVRKSIIEEKNLPTKQALENRQTRANIGLTEARTRGENLDNQITADTISNTAPLENMGITVKDNQKNVNFGQAIKVTSLMLNGKMTPFVATDVAYDANTKMHYIKGRPAPKGTEGKWEADDLGEEIAIPVSTNSISYKNLVSAINGPALSKAKGQNARARFNRFNAIEIGQPTSSEQPVTPKPAKAVTISISKIKDKFGDIVVNGKKLKDLTEKEQIEWGKENVEGGENASFVK